MMLPECVCEFVVASMMQPSVLLRESANARLCTSTQCFRDVDDVFPVPTVDAQWKVCALVVCAAYLLLNNAVNTQKKFVTE